MSESIHLAERDMSELYEYIVQTPGFLSEFPMQIVVLTEMPAFLDESIREEKAVCFLEAGGKSGLCLLRDTDDLLNTLREFFGEEQVIHAYSVESIKRATGLDVDTRIATQRLQTIYQHTVAISKQLSIKTPLILVTKLKDQRAYRYTFLDDNDDPKGDIVYVSLQGTPRMIHSLAHELRHCWQEYNAEGYFKGYVESKTRDPAYLEQKEEIDADAYASLYLNSLGYDGISMAFESNEEYLEPYWKDYITRIKKRMDEISLEMAEDSVAQ